MKKSLLILLSVLLFPSFASSQIKETALERYDLYSKCLSPEKLFIRTDKESYAPGEKILIEGYLENKSYNCEFPVSNFIYVELISPEKTLRIKLKRKKENFFGYFTAPDIAGTYLLRGYSYWMLNGSSDRFFTKTITISSDSEILPSEPSPLRVKIRPESGHALVGNSTNYSISAKRGDNPVKISGLIRDARTNEQSLLFETDDSGLGTFSFTQNSEEESYFAIVRTTDGDSVQVEVPQAISSGAVANLRLRGGIVYVQCFYTPDLQDDSLFVVFHNGSQIYHCANLSSHGQLIKLREDNLPPGVHIVQIFDAKYNILATRCFFIRPSEEDVKLYSGEDELEYMMVSSEFFGDETISPLASKEMIDRFMLTQKWEYYDMKSIFSALVPELRYGKEYVQMVIGKVTGLPKKEGKTKVTFMAPSIGFAQVAELDSSGRFQLSNIDFPDGTIFSVRPVTKKYNLEIEFDEEIFAPAYKFRNQRKEVAQKEVSKTLEEPTDTTYDKHRKIIPTYQPSQFANQEYEAMNLREEKDLAFYHNWDLMTYLADTFNGVKIVFNSNGERSLQCRGQRVASNWSISGGWTDVNIVINHRRVRMQEVEQYYVSDILTIAYLSGSDASIYSDLEYGGAVTDVAILIYTKDFSKDYMREHSTKDAPLGWQK